ncbi:hypothetical protein C4544_07395 [candidate division WS5 bacterium]|uniref:Uncharacterized protein n=1 Tax=candidate division WS5 bacterium TaxID=2093353 RepID=A0A419D9Z5_9BACT|nr:MAG: hypothetical protein C4544_07395 [candidate division WS5 bacterium]
MFDWFTNYFLTLLREPVRVTGGKIPPYSGGPGVSPLQGAFIGGRDCTDNHLVTGDKILLFCAIHPFFWGGSSLAGICHGYHAMPALF